MKDSIKGTNAPVRALEAYVNGLDCLPPAPSMMLKLVPLFQEEDPDIDKIVTLISHDPSLTAEVLKRCNSAGLRGENEIGDMFDAVSRIGFYELYRIVMAVAVARAISSNNVEIALQVEAVCRHSIATGVAANVIAQATHQSGDNSFLAGLLHDIGKVVLATAEGPRYFALTRAQAKENISLSEMEIKHFGFNHSEIGSYLLERWLLPSKIAMAVHYHHNVGKCAPELLPLTANLAIADFIAHGWENRSVTDSASLANMETALAALNLTTGTLGEIMAQAHDEIKNANRLFSTPGR